MEEGMEDGMELGCREGWKPGWTEGWRWGWWEGYRKGGTEAEMEGEMDGGGMEGRGMEEEMEGRGMKGGFEGGCTEGQTEGSTEEERQGYTEGLRQGWMETGTERGVEGGTEGGREAGWLEGWREGWKKGWRLTCRIMDVEGRDGGRNGGKEEWRQGWRKGNTEGSMEDWFHGGMEGIMDVGILKDFDKLDIDKLETEMEVIHSIKKMICHPSFESFLSKGSYDSFGPYPLNELKEYLNYVEIFMPTTTFRVQSEQDRYAVFDRLVSVARSVMDFMKHAARSQFLYYNLHTQWDTILRGFYRIYLTLNGWESDRERRRQSISKVIDAVRNPSDIIPDFYSRDLLLKEAFPALRELKESSEMFNFLSEVIDELDKPITDICILCEESSPSSIHLIGGLLSFKRSNSDAWIRVHGDLKKVIEHDYNDRHNFEAIFMYCFLDLPEFLQACLKYLACYPLDSDIPATWLTKIWIAEGFVKPEKGETLEETASNYLEQLVRRSLVSVSKRSYSGTIKYCRIPDSIHKYVIESLDWKFLVVNPDDDDKFGHLRNRIAIHPNIEYPGVKYIPVISFLAFHLDRDILGSAPYLRVLELRNSAVQETTLPKLRHLQYLGLRGSNIRMLPENIGDMKDLKTLDIRDTNIEILPESLWNILALRHVYANPRPQIKGPPPTANLSNLQILSTVVVPESWLENYPHSLINLRKLALSNMDNPACKPNPYWKSISNLLSKVVNLLSMTIKGHIVPAEFVDTRAFPNLKSVKSIKLEGRWNYFKLTIDNNEFPPNLTKLTLTKSGLKEDPMPRLERLQALKYLSLKDGAYMGKKMVCSANGFPQLQFLELSELKNLEIWEANPMAMPELTKLRVDKCCKLENIPKLEHVTDKDIVN